MEPISFRERPEDKVSDAIRDFLVMRGWFVKKTHGNAFMKGWPDLYATHRTYGARWIEVKLPDMKGSHFTKAQLSEFPKFCANGTGIWVLTGATQFEYDKLFKPHNWQTYIKW